MEEEAQTDDFQTAAVEIKAETTTNRRRLAIAGTRHMRDIVNSCG
jgi:hypothetical protein